MKTVTATEFKTHCLRFISEVERTEEPLEVTRRGKVVVMLTPPAPPARKVTYEPGAFKDRVWIVGDLNLTPEEAGWDLEGEKFKL